MSVVADFERQLSSLIEGVSEGTAQYYEDKTAAAVRKFLNDFFLSLMQFIARRSNDAATARFSPNAFGFGSTKPLTDDWMIRKVKVNDWNAVQPRLWQGISERKGKPSLSALLKRLGSQGEAGDSLYWALGGVMIYQARPGQGALKAGVKTRNGKPYNVGSGDRVSWARAVDPYVNARLAATARPVDGAKITPSGRVTIPGRRGAVSLQRALVEGFLSNGYTMSFLSKLDAFQGSQADSDELADLLNRLGLITTKERKKFTGLHRQGHPILTAYFGRLINAGDRSSNSLQSYINKALDGA